MSNPLGLEPAAACANCATPLTGKYCYACGQKTTPLTPTLKYFLHELTHELVNVDGRIYRSLRLLLTLPGSLTREMFLGRRASYVSPIRLYLIASVLYFGMGGLFGVYGNDDFLKYTADPGEVVDPAFVERMAEANRTIAIAINVQLPRALFVLVPLFAALVMLVRRRGGHTYPQHLYFALHLHATYFFLAAAGVLAGLVTLPYVEPVTGAFILLYLVAYFFVAFRRVYDTTIWGTLWRVVIVALLYIAALAFTVVAIAAPTAFPVLFGQPSQ